MHNYSRQREGILRNLKNRCDHPTAEMIYSDIQKSFPNISLGTVYRNLSLLEEMGEILRIPTGVGPDRYDGNMKPHCHFLCRRCRRLTDLKMELTHPLRTLAGDSFSGTVEGSQVLLYGNCSECAEIAAEQTY